MKTWLRITLFLTLLVVIAWPATAFAKSPYEDKVVFGGSFTLESGETLVGSLIVFGGSATLEDASTVRGDVVVFGGTVEANGVVTQNIVGLGGSITLGPNSSIGENVVMVGAQLDQAPGADIEGNVINPVTGPYVFPFPVIGESFSGGMPVPVVRTNPAWDILWFTLKLFLWAALAVLVVLFLPDHTKRTAQTVMQQPLVAGGLGLLTVVVLPILLVLLAITICLIPISILIGIIAVLAWAFGLIAVGYEVGVRLSRMFNQEWAPAASAALGTFLLILVIDGIRLVPCVGWILSAVVGMLGLGAVILTRFGARAYPAVFESQLLPYEEELPPPSPPAASEESAETPAEEPSSSEEGE